MTGKTRSVYRRGAEDGLVLGPLLALAAVLVGVTTYRAWAFLPAIAAIVAVPVAVYVMLRRGYNEDRAASTMSALWLQGICAFFFGGLIMSVVVYVCMRWLRPSFIADQFRMVIDIYSTAGQPEARELAETLQKAVNARALPTPIEMSLEMLYMAVFSGSLLSALLAVLVRRHGRRTPPPMSNY